jgi:methionyl-tRNA synthetase
VNKLGNLVSRVAGLVEKIGIEKKSGISPLVFEELDKVKKLMENFEFDKVLNEIFAYIDKSNEYIQSKKPWETKDKKVLYEVVNAIKNIAILLWPFIPSTSEKIAKQFGFKIDLKEIQNPLKISKIKKGEHLFSNIEFDNKINKEPEIKEIMEGVGQVEFSDWEKLDLRVAEIKSVENIGGADKLYKLEIDVGKLGKRTICAGIKEFYDKDELKGRK